MKNFILLPKTLNNSVFSLLIMAFLPNFAAVQTLPLALTITDTRLNDNEVAITLDAEVTQSTAFSARTNVRQVLRQFLLPILVQLLLKTPLIM